MESKSLTIKNSTDLQNSLRDEAKWEVSFAFDGSVNFFLTDTEKEYYLRTLSAGAKFVEIRGNVLSGQFLFIRLSGDWLRKQRVNKLEEHEEISDEQRQLNLERMQELRKSVWKK